MFDLSVMWLAFRDAGMLDQVRIEDSETVFDVNIAQPDMAMFDDQAQAPDFRIEYQTDDAPELTSGCIVIIDAGRYAGRYRVSRKPMRDSTGFFSTVPLGRLR